ncbi:MAG: hypothetical protein LWX56_12910 [Ignavibacteria bacterium]|nr:hypothetical protein [Ignavibacteria bacterium]
MVHFTYYLKHNFPHLATGLPEIEYAVPVDSKVIVEVYNLAGKRIITLVDGKKSAGQHRIDLTPSKKKLPHGTYFCRLAAYDDADSMKYVNVRKFEVASNL